MLRKRQSRGSALLIAVILALVAAGMAAAFLTISVYQSRTTFVAANRENALTIAEAGLDEVAFRMNTWDLANPPLSALTGSIGAGTYTIEITPPFAGVPGQYIVRSTSVIGDEKRGIEAVLAPQMSLLFDFGAFGDRGVHIDSNGYLDSYNSDSGSYASQLSGNYKGQRYARTNGDTGSNVGITMDSNAKIFGDAVPGPGAGVTLRSNAYVSGFTMAAAAPKSMPPITLPPAAALPASSMSVGNNDSATIPAGSYHFSSLSTDSNSSLTIVGPATIVVDDFTTNSNSTIVVDASAGPVEIYGTGRFSLDSNSTVSSVTQKPEDLSIQITTDNYTGYESTTEGNPALPVSIDSNASLYATVYAPNAIMDLNSNGALFGALVAKKVTVNSNFGVHYDEALAALGTPGPFRLRSWLEFVPGN